MYVKSQRYRIKTVETPLEGDMPILTAGALAASRDLTARLLGYIRSGKAVTRVELAELTGMSRTNMAEARAEEQARIEQRKDLAKRVEEIKAKEGEAKPNEAARRNPRSACSPAIR